MFPWCPLALGFSGQQVALWLRPALRPLSPRPACLEKTAPTCFLACRLFSASRGPSGKVLAKLLGQGRALVLLLPFPQVCNFMSLQKLGAHHLFSNITGMLHCFLASSVWVWISSELFLCFQKKAPVLCSPSVCQWDLWCLCCGLSHYECPFLF